MKQKIIISGHSSGLGKALADYYGRMGIAVLGISRRQLPERQGLQQSVLDLSDSRHLENWLADGSMAAFMQGADEVVLINNAATVLPNAVCGRQRPSETIHAMALNVTAPLLLSNHLLAHQAEGQQLKIVHISSGAGRHAYPGWSVYGASKAALDHHARCIAAENPIGVKAASIAPGVVDTDMQAEIRRSDAADFPLTERFCRLKSEQGLSSPEEVAEHIAAMIAHQDFGAEVIQDVRHWTA